MQRSVEIVSGLADFYDDGGESYNEPKRKKKKKVLQFFFSPCSYNHFEYTKIDSCLENYAFFFKTIFLANIPQMRVGYELLDSGRTESAIISSYCQQV